MSMNVATQDKFGGSTDELNSITNCICSRQLTVSIYLKIRGLPNPNIPSSPPHLHIAIDFSNNFKQTLSYKFVLEFTIRLHIQQLGQLALSVWFTKSVNLSEPEFLQTRIYRSRLYYQRVYILILDYQYFSFSKVFLDYTYWLVSIFLLGHSFVKQGTLAFDPSHC